MQKLKTNKNHTSHLAPHTLNKNNCIKSVGESCVRHNSRGITLIALIITIIVMIILVGVTVNIALNGGLFTATEKAAKDTQIEVDKEILMSSAIGALGQNGKVDFTKLDQNLPEGFTGSNGIYTNGKNTYKVDKYGNVELVEPETEKEISADDEEASYWKTDGQGTILYYEVPEGVEVPETLIVPCKIGDEKITRIEMFALCGLEVQRNEDGSVVLDEKGNPIFIEGETNEEGIPIPTTSASKVKNIIISKGIESMGMYSIFFCTSLKEITIPSTLTNLNENIDGHYGGGIVVFCNSMETVKISDGAAKICDALFNGGSSIKNVIIPDTVTKIGEYAFPSCTSLQNIKLPDSLEYIGESAFKDCTSLQSINLSDSLEYIGDSAFENCTSLKDIGSTKGLITIESEAFKNCTSIESIYVPETVDNLRDSVFSGWTSSQTIRMGKEEEPALVWSHYSETGWTKSWQSNCNAQVLWGQKN